MSVAMQPWETVISVLRVAAQQRRLDWTKPIQETFCEFQVDPAALPDAWETQSWWGPIDEIVRDPQTHDIYINGPNRRVLIGQKGRIEALELQLHHEWVVWVQQRLQSRHIGKANHQWKGTQTGVADGGSGVRRLRYALTDPTMTPDGPTVTIRVLPANWPNLDDLIIQGMLPRGAAELLLRALHADVTILISGGTGAGKSTLAAALKHAIPHQRTVVIQDAPELPTSDPFNDVSYIVGDGDTTAFLRCVRHALRQQPQRIIIGEGRGPELLAMIEGAATGHPGLTTIHAANALDALLRLETYACSAPHVTESIVRSNLSKLALIAIHVARIEGARQISQIIELRRGSDPTPGAPFEYGMIWSLSNGILTRTDDPVRGAWAQEVLR